MRGWNTCPLGNCGLEETDPATSYIPFRFTSKEYDEETGLYYYGARYYEPRLSRWMSADPAGWELINPMDEDGKPVPDGWPEGFGPGPRVGMRPGYSVIEATNWYAYVSNNPVLYVDPTGEDDILFHLEGEVAILGFGFDLSVGLVLDTDYLSESGINVSGGLAEGITDGIAAGVAWFSREAEGKGTSVDFNFGPASISFYSDDQGLNGFGITVGQGIGVVSRTDTISKTMSIDDLAEKIPRELDLTIPFTPPIRLF